MRRWRWRRLQYTPSPSVAVAASAEASLDIAHATIAIDKNVWSLSTSMKPNSIYCYVNAVLQCALVADALFGKNHWEKTEAEPWSSSLE